MIKKIKAAWDKFDWWMFVCALKLLDEEPDSMPTWRLQYRRTVHDIFMILAMFGAFTYAGALLYEDMSYKALGFVPPNFIQYAPLMMMVVLAVFMGFAGHKLERLENEHNAGKGHE